MQQRQLELALDTAIQQARFHAANDHDAPNIRPRPVPVRRRSRMKGREGVFWRPVRRADLRVLYAAAERRELVERLKPGSRGAMGMAALRILKELMNLVDFRTGQLDPCYDTLAERTGFARSTVARCLKVLREFGFLDWIRRVEPDPVRAGERGPQVRQTSNAYRFCMPAFIGRLMGVFAHGAPLPEDDEDRRRDHRANLQRWEFEASPLGEAIAKLHAAFKQA